MQLKWIYIEAHVPYIRKLHPQSYGQVIDLMKLFSLGTGHHGYALLPLFLVVIITFRACFLSYDDLLFAGQTPGMTICSQQLVSSIIYHSYELWSRKVVRNLPYKKQCKLRTAAYFTQVIYCNISAFSDINSDNH